MRSDTGWTIRYSLLNIAYFAAFCTIHACAAVFLLAHGFTNTQIGILLAVANISSAVLQPYIAGVIDKPGPLTNRRFIMIAVGIILAGSVILLFVNNNKVIIFVIYALIYMIQFAYQPVMTALFFEYQKAGCNIYYGLARGLGSAGFAVTSVFIGGAIERNGVTLLLYVNIAVMAVSMILIATFIKPKGEATEVSCGSEATGAAIAAETNAADRTNTESIDEGTGADNGVGSEAVDGAADTGAGSDAAQTAHNNIVDFTHTYPAFMLFMLATICFFFAHNMINDFMIQIIQSLGGTETHLGYSNFLQAILELPVMALIPFVLKKVSSNKLLIVSGVAFFIKILILLFAANLAMMFVSQSFQLFAYAVFIPAAAYYVSENMSELDQVKGQAYVTSAITLGGVFSNLISGVILDNLGIKIMLLTGTIVCFVGVIIGYRAMRER